MISIFEQLIPPHFFWNSTPEVHPTLENSHSIAPCLLKITKRHKTETAR